MGNLFLNLCEYRFFHICGILPDNNDEVKIIIKGLHISLDNNFNIEDGIPSIA